VGSPQPSGLSPPSSSPPSSSQTSSGQPGSSTPSSNAISIGVATCATQIEGADDRSEWRGSERKNLLPPSGSGNDFATNYSEDLGALAELGFRAIRLSLDWSRLAPRAGEFNAGAVEHYRQILITAKNVGLDVWACLFHAAAPGWFADEGGFAEERARNRRWPAFVDESAQAFGDLVAGWIPIHDPVGYARHGYLLGRVPPFRTDRPTFDVVLGAMFIAHRDAWRVLRGGPPVATSFAAPPVYSAEPTVDARRARSAADRLLWQTWVRALRDGVIDIPAKGETVIADLAGACDLVGITYEHAVAVQGNGRLAPYPNGARLGTAGSAPWPEGLGIALHRVAEELPDRPNLIAAHGAAVEDESWREDLVRGAIEQVREALTDGIDVRGLLWWTGIDGYELRRGFTPHYGLIGRDRVPRAAAEVLGRAALEQPAALKGSSEELATGDVPAPRPDGG